MSNRSRPLSFRDLAVLAFILLLVPVAGARWIQSVREGDNRTICARNLRQIGQAIQIYANENKGAFPRALLEMGPKGPVDNPIPTEYTGVNAPSAFQQPGAPGPND